MNTPNLYRDFLKQFEGKQGQISGAMPAISFVLDFAGPHKLEAVRDDYVVVQFVWPSKAVYPLGCFSIASTQFS